MRGPEPMTPVSNAPHRALRRGLELALVALFALAIVAPTVDLGLRPHGVRSVLRENRNPAPPPKRITGLFTLSRFPSVFESWFDDRFGLRDLLLRGWQAQRLFVFGAEASPTLIAGKQGWLFFGADNSVAVQRGLAPLSEAELEEWRTNLEARRDWLRARGIEHAFVIAPNKQSIYPELMPDELAPLGPTRLDQLSAWLRERSDVRFVDLRAALIAEKEHDQDGDFVYYPLGSHWTWRGGFAAWNAVAESFAGAVPAFRPIPREACARTLLDDGPGDSMAAHTYIADLVHQRTFGFLPVDSPVRFTRDERGAVTSTTQDDASLPVTMLVHDSFGGWFVPFAALRSSRLDAVWQHSFPKEAVAEALPHVVVQLYTERVLVWGQEKLSPEIDLVDAATFAGYAPSWGPLDLKHGPLPATEGNVRVARTPEGLAIEQLTENGLVDLPAFEPPPGTELAVHFVLTAPARTYLTFFYQVAQDRRFARSRAALVAVDPGLNDVRFRLRLPDVRGPLKLRMGSRGAYVLHAIEARAAR